METPNPLRGYFYPTSRIQKCPAFHACTLSKKCQNYDKHQALCNMCESRVDPPPAELGGQLPEGEYYPDLQLSFKIIEDRLRVPFAHPDSKTRIDNRNCSGLDNDPIYEQAKETFSKYSGMPSIKVMEMLDENRKS